MPRVLVLTRDIAAPPSVVWGILTDVDGSPGRMHGIDRVERIPGPDGEIVEGYDVGTAWRETRHMLGQSATEDMTVTKVEPGRSTTIEADSGGIHYVTSFHLDPTPGGTTLTFEFSGEYRDRAPASYAKNVMLNLMGAIGRSATKRAVLGDLDDIARAAEAARSQSPED